MMASTGSKIKCLSFLEMAPLSRKRRRNPRPLFTRHRTSILILALTQDQSLRKPKRRPIICTGRTGKKIHWRLHKFFQPNRRKSDQTPSSRTIMMGAILSRSNSNQKLFRTMTELILKWEGGLVTSTKNSSLVSIIILLKKSLALRIYGKDWQKVQEFIKTRSSA